MKIVSHCSIEMRCNNRHNIYVKMFCIFIFSNVGYKLIEAPYYEVRCLPMLHDDNTYIQLICLNFIIH